jgi:hypothetical protein
MIKLFDFGTLPLARKLPFFRMVRLFWGWSSLQTVQDWWSDPKTKPFEQSTAEAENCLIL